MAVKKKITPKMYVEIGPSGDVVTSLPYKSLDHLVEDALGDMPPDGVDIYELVSVGKFKAKITAEKV